MLLSKAPSANPKVYLAPKAGIPTSNQMIGEWNEFATLFQSSRNLSCPCLLFSSKRQTVSLFIGGKKKYRPLSWWGKLDSQQGEDAAGNIAEENILGITYSSLTVLSELRLFFFHSNPLLCYFGGEQELVISSLNSYCEWRDFGQTEWEEDSQLWVPTETHLSFYHGLSWWRKGKRGRWGVLVAGLDKLLVFHCCLPGG